MNIIKTFNTYSMLDILRPYLPVEQAAQELCFLAVWATWHLREFGQIDISATELQTSFEQANHALDTSLFSDSRLLHKLPMPLVDELIKSATSLAQAAVKEPSEVALALISLIQGAELRDPAVYIPEQLGELLADVVGRDTQNVSLYHPSSLMALCMLHNPKSASLTVSGMSPLVLAVTTLLECTCHISTNDRIFTQSRERSDFVISVPPMGLKVQSHELDAGKELRTITVRSDEGALERAVDEIQKRGVLLLPTSVLFSRSAIEVRKTLVDNNWLHTLVHVPERQLLNTAIPSVCLIIDKTRKADEPVEFLDTPKGEFNRFIEYRHIEEVMAHGFHLDTTAVETNRIKQQDYDLSFGRYKQTGLLTVMENKKASSISLEGVAEIIRAQALQGEEVLADEAPNTFLEISPRDISEAGIVNTPAKAIRLDDKAARRAEKQLLQPGDILLAVKGNLGSIALVSANCGSNWIAGQTFVIIRPRQAIIGSEFLYRYLSSNLIQAYLATLATGAAMKIIKAGDLSDLPVELPSAEEKAQVETNHRAILEEYQAIQQHREAIEQLKDEFWPVPN